MKNKTLKTTAHVFGKTSKFIASRYIKARVKQAVREQTKEKTCFNNLLELCLELLRFLSIIELLTLSIYIGHLRQKDRAEALAQLVSGILQRLHIN